jgi:hypothetical protein
MPAVRSRRAAISGPLARIAIVAVVFAAAAVWAGVLGPFLGGCLSSLMDGYTIYD